MTERLAIYCSRCEWWHDTNDPSEMGPIAGIPPLCPKCRAPLFQKHFKAFKAGYKDHWEEVLSWKTQKEELKAK